MLMLFCLLYHCSLAQNFVNQDGKPYDAMRTLRMGTFGFLIHGTTGHYFYGFLDGKLPGTAPLTVATKVGKFILDLTFVL